MEVKIEINPTQVARTLAGQMVHWHELGTLRNIALSGGSTPKLLFDLLASEFREALPWKELTYFWGDERCVPPDYEQSNYGMTRQRLLEPLAIPDKQVFRIMGEADPESEADRYGGLLREQLPLHHGIPQFDLILLGLGTDGHTASIFPHEMGLWDAPGFCDVATHPESGQKRITLTGQVINQARRVVFLVTGSSKAERVEEILGRKEPYLSYPATRVAPADGSLIWLLDKAAAEKL